MRLALRRKPVPAPEPLRSIDHGDPEGWQVLPQSSAPAGYTGPFLVGYGTDWQEFEDFATAWTAHVVRGSTRYASRLLWKPEFSSGMRAAQQAQDETTAGKWDE